MKPETSLAVTKLSCDRCNQLHKRHPDTAADGGTAVWYHNKAGGSRRCNDCVEPFGVDR